MKAWLALSFGQRCILCGRLVVAIAPPVGGPAIVPLPTEGVDFRDEPRHWFEDHFNAPILGRFQGRESLVQVERAVLSRPVFRRGTGPTTPGACEKRLR